MDGEVTSDSCFIEASEPESLEPMKKCGGSDTAALPGAASASGCFDCNICLDFAVDPVVTLCGHLYCWPCIYKWLDQAPLETQVQQCPVCKASLSQSALVPLYGRGNKPGHHALEDIPRRPPSLHRPASEPESPRSPVLHHRLDHRPYYGYPYGDHVSPPASPMRTPPTGARMFHYTSGGVLGGMAIAVLPWVLRNQEVGGQYGGGLSPPRVRRQEMQVERSLHQIWVFFCCCALLCLLLF